MDARSRGASSPSSRLAAARTRSRSKLSVSLPPIPHAAGAAARNGDHLEAPFASDFTRQQSILCTRPSLAEGTASAVTVANLNEAAVASGYSAADAHPPPSSPQPHAASFTPAPPLLALTPHKVLGRDVVERRPQPQRLPSASQGRSAAGSDSNPHLRDALVGVTHGTSRSTMLYNARRPTHKLTTHQVAAEVNDAEAEAAELMRAGNASAALSLLAHAIQLVQDYQRAPANAADSATASNSTSGTLTWGAETALRLALTYTVHANGYGVQCGAAAEPLAVQVAGFQAAMRWLVSGPEEVLFPEWRKVKKASKPPLATPHPPKTSSKGGKAPPSCFASETTGRAQALLQLLRCAVRNNAAVCLGDRATRGGEARIVYELLTALAESRGVWSVTVFYNLAVSFLHMERYDDAAEAIARHMELSTHYLHGTEMLLRNAHSSRLCDMTASALHAHMALQLIRGHHFIASMAAWCDPDGALEVYHCELAAGCASRYLSMTHGATAKQLECQRRLVAAQTRASAAAFGGHEGRVGTGGGDVGQAAAGATPPLLPLLTQELLLPCGQAETSSTLTGNTVNMQDVVETLFTMSTTANPTATTLDVDLPAEVRAYVRAVVKDAEPLRYWAREARRCGAAPPFLSAAAAVVPLNPPYATAEGEQSTGSRSQSSAAMRSRVVKRTASRTPSAEQREVIMAATFPRPPRHPASAASSRPDSAMRQSTCRASKPAPLFLTTLPQRTYQRYRSLRNSVVSALQVAEEEEGVRWDASVNARVVDKGQESWPLHETASVPPFVHGSAQRDSLAAVSQGRRMTALLFGASSTTATPASTPAAKEGQGRTDVEREQVVRASMATAAASATFLAVPVRPSELLRQLDSEAEARYSRLLVDPLADKRRDAATRLQSWWRMRKACRERQHRTAAVLLLREQDIAALPIQCLYRKWKARQPDVAQLQKLRRAHQQKQSVTVVQAFVRQRESVEVWGRLCLALHTKLVKEHQEEMHRVAGAVTLQSWFRMHAAQTALRSTMRAVVRIQSAWRCSHARHELQQLRRERRLAEEQWRQERLPQITHVQRWWRACVSRRNAAACMTEKQRAVEAYLATAQLHDSDTLRRHVRNPNEAVAAARRVFAVLAGAQDRRRLGSLYRSAQIRSRAVERFVLRVRGAKEREHLRKQRRDALALQRRREEVTVATCRLQAWARAWLPRSRARWAGNLDRQQHASATAIQSAYRRHRARQGLAASHSGRTTTEAAQRLAAAHDEAATRIQSVWRMWQVRREWGGVLDFVVRGRHRHATAIQRAWRGHYARTVIVPQRCEDVLEYEERVQQRSLRACAATRIQAFYRMFATRFRLQADNRVQLPASQLYRNAAARRIQARWRVYAAKSSVHQRVLQRCRMQQQQQSQEALHAYATRIQALVRSFLARRALSCSQRKQESEQQRASQEQLPPVSPLSVPVQTLFVPHPPPVVVLHTTNGPSYAPVESGEPSPQASLRDTLTAAAGVSGPPLPASAPLCGFGVPSGVATPASTSPLTAGLMQNPYSGSASQQSLSRLTNTTDRPLQFFESGTTADYQDSFGRTRAPSPFYGSSSSSSTDDRSDDDQSFSSSGEGNDMHAKAEGRSSVSDSIATKEGLIGVAEETHAAITLTAAPEQAQPVSPLSPAPLPPRPQRILCTSECRHTPQEHAAAVRIQAVWRGFNDRSRIEYYYEECSEEVSGEEEEEEGEYEEDYEEDYEEGEEEEDWEDEEEYEETDALQQSAADDEEEETYEETVGSGEEEDAHLEYDDDYDISCYEYDDDDAEADDEFGVSHN